MKGDQTEFIADKFSIVDRECEEGVIAIREKASVQINQQNSSVKMHDFMYSFDEIIAIADKLKAIKAEDEKELTFS